MSPRIFLPWLFAGTLFLSAVLLFLVELIMAKMILPLLGGSPSVWNTCMVFYQAVLLAGYAYAHASSAWLRTRRQLLLHMVLVVVPVVALPLGVAEQRTPPAEESPVIWLLWLLLVSVGLPFFALSASNPLLQKWFTRTGHLAGKDPYFLYAASNLGSILALLCYPTLLEPSLPVKKEHWLSQSWLWTLGYGLLIVLVLGCAWVVSQALDDQPKDSSVAKPAVPQRATPPVVAWSPDHATTGGVLTRLRWVALAFVPSSLMLGVTTYITQDLAAIPLVWVIPLALYLLSFILVFARWPERVHQALLLVLPPLLLVLILQMHGVFTPRTSLLIGMHLLVLVVVALVCHGALALTRPGPRSLTEFYLWLSFGGVLGGLFNALLAPAIFQRVAEYPIGLVLACLLLPSRPLARQRWIARLLSPSLAKPVNLLADLLLAGLVGLVSYKLIELFAAEQVHANWLRNLRDALTTKYFPRLGKALGIRPVEAGAIVLFGIPLLLSYLLATRPLRFLLALAYGVGIPVGALLPRREPALHYLFVRRPLQFGLGVGAFMLCYVYWAGSEEQVVYRTRNFYGLLKVSAATIQGVPMLKLASGTTTHGYQWYHRDPGTIAAFFAPAAVSPPLDTPVRYLTWAEMDREPLGYYHRTGPIGQVFAEFCGPQAKQEIAVIGLGTGTLASYGEPGQSFLFFEIDPDVVKVARTYFTYLENCRAQWGIVLGDARLQMKRANPGQFQLIVVDAFNSDAIPVHLLTREALALYLQKLSEDGIVALHVSNRYLNLEPVLGNLADALGLVGLFQFDHDVAGKPGKTASQWIVLARRKEDLGNLVQDRRWRPLERRPQLGVWTDDYTNVLSVFRWK